MNREQQWVPQCWVQADMDRRAAIAAHHQEQRQMYEYMQARDFHELWVTAEQGWGQNRVSKASVLNAAVQSRLRAGCCCPASTVVWLWQVHVEFRQHRETMRRLDAEEKQRIEEHERWRAAQRQESQPVQHVMGMGQIATTQSADISTAKRAKRQIGKLQKHN